MIFSFVQLSNCSPLLTSKTRQIYEHPEDPNFLIKVHRKSRNSGSKMGVRAWFYRAEDHFLYTSGMLRDLEQFVESRYKDYGDIVEHIAPIYGVVDTDIGLGLVVAAIRDAEGHLAPTLKGLFKTGQMNAQRQAMLNRLLQSILDTPLVIGDLNQENIVLQNSGSTDERFMLIDGLGERTWIPIQRYIKAASHRQKQKFANKIKAKLEQYSDV